MPEVVEFVSFKVKEGISEQQLLAASDEFNEGFLSLQKGYVSRRFIKEGDTWADLVLWETMEDAMNAVNAVEKSPAAESYDACIEQSTCKMQHLTIVKNY